MLEHYQLSKLEKIPVYFDHPSYTVMDAFGDAISLGVPFIGIAITLFIFRRFSPDSILSTLSNKKSFKIEGLRNIKVKFADVAGMEEAKK